MPEFDQRDQSPEAQVNVAGSAFFGTQATAPTPTVPQQIPQPPVDFTGRTEEINDLLSKIASGGVTISGVRGAGGIGKTALAFVLAHRLAAKYSHGQVFLNLRGVDEKKQKPVTVAEALSHVIRSFLGLDIPLPAEESQLQGHYQSVLTGKRVLLLMDNAANADQVRPLIPPPGCALIVTSRWHFHLPGLEPLDLTVMKPEDAHKLILKIAPRIGDLAPVLAKRCGYLPFALCLAGAALAERPNVTPEDYLCRLADLQKRLELIQSSLKLSYDLLDEKTQGLWRMLAVFPGSFDSAAAEAVWELNTDPAADALGELVKASMVEWDDTAKRYHLHDLARDFAASCLSKDEHQSAQRRHAQRYKTVLRDADVLFLRGGESLVQGLHRFDREWVNIREGQAWAATHIAEDEVAARLGNDYPDAGVDCLSLRLHSREWIEWLMSGLSAARRLKDRKAEGNHLGNLGCAYAALGDVRRAVEYYEKALAISRQVGSRRDEGSALGDLGLAHSALGNIRRAIEYYEQHLKIAREIGDRRGEGNSLGNLGMAYAALGDVRRAIEYYEMALAIDREIGNWRGEGICLSTLGLAYADLGDVRRAIEYYEKALAIDREIGDRREEGANLGNLGSAYLRLGDVRRAIEYHGNALAISRQVGSRRDEGTALGNLGLAYADLGDVRRAIEYYEKALAILQEIGDRRSEGALLGNLGLAYAALGDVRRAIEYYEKALAIHREIGDRRSEGAHLGNLGLAYVALGDVRRAIEYYEQCLAIHREIRDRRGEGHALFNMSLSLDTVGRRDEAIANVKAALAIYEQIEDPNAQKARKKLEEWRAQK
jgi:tetratricopeptide (TPR) repeat protein